MTVPGIVSTSTSMTLKVDNGVTLFRDLVDDASIGEQLSAAAAFTTTDPSLNLGTASSLMDSGRDGVTNILRASDDPMVVLAAMAVVVLGLGLVAMSVPDLTSILLVQEEDPKITSRQKESKNDDSRATILDQGGEESSFEAGTTQVEDRQQQQQLLEEEEEDRKVLSGVDAATDDTWTLQGLDVMHAFQKQDRNQLRTILGGILGSLRSTRQELQSERMLRQETEAALTVAGEQFRDLEDQYELGQNQLQRTRRALDETQTQLVQTTEKLEVTSQSLEELQREQQSLRKLGQVAWRLSKDRVRNRLAKVRNRFAKRDTANEEEK